MFSFSMPKADASARITLQIDSITVENGESLRVPIRISNNTGICGATISIRYDERLVLKDIEKGEALSSLTMTKPGSMAENPVNLLFDGVEEDISNGVIAYLCFDTIYDNGVYDISVSYSDGDIVNGNLEALEVELIEGQIIIGSSSEGDDYGDAEESVGEHNGPVIKIGNVAASPGESVEVPVYISGNTGICGATFKISYNNSLTLTQIVKGDALPELTMTRPGDLTANPFNLVFDGIEQDDTNGLFFTLTFTAPHDNGIYEIVATHDEGDVVDGDLNPVDIPIEKGSVAVGSSNVEVLIGDITVNLTPLNCANGNVFVAFYNELDEMTSIEIFELNSTQIKADIDTHAAYAKVFCWSEDLNPLCDAQKITLK